MAPAATWQPREAAPAPNPDDTILSTLAFNLLARQQQQPTTAIPSYYGSLNSGPGPGEVVGIVLGSVGGFILLLWLLYTIINLGNPDSGATNETSTVVTEGTGSVYVRRRHHNHHDKRRASVSRSRRGHEEMIEIHRAHARPVIVEETATVSSAPLSSEPPGRVIVEETTRSSRRRRSSVSRPRSSMPPPPPRRVEEVDDDDDDEVVVIEEHSPPRRRQRSRVRSVERRSSGYREVDPERFAGGDGSFIEVRRSGSHHRR